MKKCQKLSGPLVVVKYVFKQSTWEAVGGIQHGSQPWHWMGLCFLVSLWPSVFVTVTMVEFKKQRLAIQRSFTDTPLPIFLTWAMMFSLPPKWAPSIFYLYKLLMSFIFLASLALSPIHTFLLLFLISPGTAQIGPLVALGGTLSITLVWVNNLHCFLPVATAI